MQVAIVIETSEGEAVKIFDEHVENEKQVDLLSAILSEALKLEQDLKFFIEELTEK